MGYFHASRAWSNPRSLVQTVKTALGDVESPCGTQTRTETP